MRSVELFAGAGGLALGISRAGFQHSLVIEWDRHAVATLRANQTHGGTDLHPWPIVEGDVTSFPFEDLSTEPDLLSGGVPCQPFSLGGKHGGRRDDRNMFPMFVDAVRRLQPKAIMVENVKGLMRGSFRPYFEYILRSLSLPECAAGALAWTEHDQRLRQIENGGGKGGLRYDVSSQLLNAADHGVPQHRERVFIVGFRSDLRAGWRFPRATHSRSALDFDKRSGEYWERHALPNPRPTEPTPFISALPPALPWVTVRDVVSDLPCFESPAAIRLQHWFQPGARPYPGHTGSALDEPAKTLKAGVHGVPGGENMRICDDGSVRYFSVREAARIQTFPDEYMFAGSWSEMMRQIGNAVPVELAEMLATEIAEHLQRSPRGIGAALPSLAAPGV